MALKEINLNEEPNAESQIRRVPAEKEGASGRFPDYSLYS